MNGHSGYDGRDAYTALHAGRRGARFEAGEADGVPAADFVQLDPHVRAYVATPGAGDDDAGRGMLFFHYGFGLNAFMQAECRRLARAGYTVVAPDIFRGDTFDYDTIPQCKAKIETLTDAGMLADAAASMAHLDARFASRTRPVGAIGFCFGGRLAVLTAIEHGARIAAAVSFYGTGIAPDQRGFFDSIAARLPGLASPVMLLYGSRDPSILPAEHARITSILSEHHKDFVVSVYGGAEHSFASDDGGTHYDARVAEDAWGETLEFFTRKCS